MNGWGKVPWRLWLINSYRAFSPTLEQQLNAMHQRGAKGNPGRGKNDEVNSNETNAARRPTFESRGKSTTGKCGHVLVQAVD